MQKRAVAAAAATPFDKKSTKTTAAQVLNRSYETRVKWSSLYNVQHILQLSTELRTKLMELLLQGAQQTNPEQMSMLRNLFLELLNVHDVPTSAQMATAVAMIVCTHFAIVQHIIAKLVECAYVASSMPNLRKIVQTNHKWREFLEAVIHFGVVVSNPATACTDLLDAEGLGTLDRSLQALRLYPSSAAKSNWFGDTQDMQAFIAVIKSAKSLCLNDAALSQVTTTFEQYLRKNVFIEDVLENRKALRQAVALFDEVILAVVEPGSIHHRTFQFAHVYLTNKNNTEHRKSLINTIIQPDNVQERIVVAKLVELWNTVPAFKSVNSHECNLYTLMSMSFITPSDATNAAVALTRDKITMRQIYDYVCAFSSAVQVDRSNIPDVVSLVDCMAADSTCGYNALRLNTNECVALVHLGFVADVDTPSLQNAMLEYRASKRIAERYAATSHTNDLLIHTDSSLRQLQSATLLQFIRTGQCDIEPLVTKLRQHPNYSQFVAGLNFLANEDARCGYFAASQDTDLQYLMQQHGLLWLPELLPPHDNTPVRDDDDEIRASEMRATDIELQDDREQLNMKMYEATRKMIDLLIADANKDDIDMLGGKLKILPFADWKFNDEYSMVGTFIRQFQEGLLVAHSNKGVDLFNTLKAIMSNITIPQKILASVRITTSTAPEERWQEPEDYYNVIHQNTTRAFGTLTFILMVLNVILTFYILRHAELQPALLRQNASIYAHAKAHILESSKPKYAQLMDKLFTLSPQDPDRPYVEMRQLLVHLQQLRHALATYKREWVLVNPFKRFKHLLALPQGTALLNTSFGALGLAYKYASDYITAPFEATPDTTAKQIPPFVPKGNILNDLVQLQSLEQVTPSTFGVFFKFENGTSLAEFTQPFDAQELQDTLSSTLNMTIDNPYEYLVNTTIRYNSIQQTMADYYDRVSNTTIVDWGNFTQTIEALPVLTRNPSNGTEVEQIVNRWVGITRIIDNFWPSYLQAREVISRTFPTPDAIAVSEFIHDVNVHAIAASPSIPRDLPIDATRDTIWQRVRSSAIITLTTYPKPLLDTAASLRSWLMTQMAPYITAGTRANINAPIDWLLANVTSSSIAIGGVVLSSLALLWELTFKQRKLPSGEAFNLPNFTTIPPDVFEDDMFTLLLPQSTTAAWSTTSTFLDFVGRGIITHHGISLAKLYAPTVVGGIKYIAPYIPLVQRLSFLSLEWRTVVVTFIFMLFLLFLYSQLLGLLKPTVQKRVNAYYKLKRIGSNSSAVDTSMSAQFEHVVPKQ